jgi:hypothetical protein
MAADPGQQRSQICVRRLLLCFGFKCRLFGTDANKLCAQEELPDEAEYPIQLLPSKVLEPAYAR